MDVEDHILWVELKVLEEFRPGEQAVMEPKYSSDVKMSLCPFWF